MPNFVTSTIKSVKYEAEGGDHKIGNEVPHYGIKSQCSSKCKLLSD